MGATRAGLAGRRSGGTRSEGIADTGGLRRAIFGVGVLRVCQKRVSARHKLFGDVFEMWIGGWLLVIVDGDVSKE
jgi:hypothetical protein